MSWVLTILGIVALIVLHELGHFTAAKLVGMRVERFSLFFPPTLLRVRRGETEYALGAIPAGGYVKITGMNPEELGDLDPEVDSDHFAGIPIDEFAWARQHRRRLVLIWVAVVLTLTGLVATAGWTLGEHLTGLL